MSPINEDGLQRDSAVGAMTVTKHVDLVHSVSERQDSSSNLSVLAQAKLNERDSGEPKAFYYTIWIRTYT
jgi:hypothetical protein